MKTTHEQVRSWEEPEMLHITPGGIDSMYSLSWSLRQNGIFCSYVRHGVWPSYAKRESGATPPDRSREMNRPHPLKMLPCLFTLCTSTTPLLQKNAFKEKNEMATLLSLSFFSGSIQITGTNRVGSWLRESSRPGWCGCGGIERL